MQSYKISIGKHRYLITPIGLTLFLIILAFKRAQYHPRKGVIGSFVNSKLSQTKCRIMEHFGFLIVPADIIPFCLAFEKYKEQASLVSHENNGETKAVKTSLCFTKIAVKVNLWHKNFTLLRFLLLDQAQFVEALCDFHGGILDMFLAIQDLRKYAWAISNG